MLKEPLYCVSGLIYDNYWGSAVDTDGLLLWLTFASLS